MSKTLYILVGLPGSGKSTFTNTLSNPLVCSADHWFEKGNIWTDKVEYDFKPEELPQAHAACKGRAHGAMQSGNPLVVIDNTNLSQWERADYIAMGIKYGYNIQIKLFDVTPEVAAARNTHGVPLEACQRMAARMSANDLAVDIGKVMDHNQTICACYCNTCTKDGWCGICHCDCTVAR